MPGDPTRVSPIKDDQCTDRRTELGESHNITII